MKKALVNHAKILVGACLALTALMILGCGASAAPPAATPVVVEKEVVEVEKSVPQPEFITITDIAGRQVTVKAPVESVLLGEGRQMYMIAALEPEDPFKRVVGWPDDFRTTDLDAYNLYKEKFPRMADIPVFGRPGRADFSVEKAVALKPDVLILNLDAYNPSRETVIPHMEKAGIPVVVIDFRQYPFENTVPSALIMGKLFGQEARAQELVDFYIQHINTVYDKVAEIEEAGEPKPLAFIYRAARFGGDCCNTFGRGNMGLFVERAGGRNLGSEVIPGWSGTVNPEAVLAADPNALIVTGSNWAELESFQGFEYVTFGYDAMPEQSRTQLKAGIEQTPGWTNLQAYQDGRVHGIWHQFYNSPYSFYAFLQFAKWLHPEEFTDLDPGAVFQEFHEKFLPLPYSGTFSVTMEEE